MLALRDHKLLSLNQIWRLFWPAAKDDELARKRLSKLNHQYGLIECRHVPKVELAAAHLAYSKVYGLTEPGRAWLVEAGFEPGRQPKLAQTIHDLLTAEIRTRLAELVRRRGESWSLTWIGEDGSSFFRSRQAERPLLIPDGLAIINRQQGGKTEVLPLFIELDASREGHGRPSSRIGRKIRGYDEFSRRWLNHEVLGTLPCFPAVLLITHGEQRLQNLVQAVAKQRRQPVAYALALTNELLTAEADVLTAPCWRLLPAGAKTLTGPIEVEPQALLGQSGWLKSLYLNGRSAVRPTPQPVAGHAESALAASPASKAAPAKSIGTEQNALPPALPRRAAVAPAPPAANSTQAQVSQAPLSASRAAPAKSIGTEQNMVPPTLPRRAAVAPAPPAANSTQAQVSRVTLPASQAAPAKSIGTEQNALSPALPRRAAVAPAPPAAKSTQAQVSQAPLPASKAAPAKSTGTERNTVPPTAKSAHPEVTPPAPPVSKAAPVKSTRPESVAVPPVAKTTRPEVTPPAPPAAKAAPVKVVKSTEPKRTTPPSPVAKAHLSLPVQPWPDSPALRQARAKSGLLPYPITLPIFRPATPPQDRLTAMQYRRQRQSWQLYQSLQRGRLPGQVGARSQKAQPGSTPLSPFQPDQTEDPATPGPLGRLWRSLFRPPA